MLPDVLWGRLGMLLHKSQQATLALESESELRAILGRLNARAHVMPLPDLLDFGFFWFGLHRFQQEVASAEA